MADARKSADEEPLPPLPHEHHRERSSSLAADDTKSTQAELEAVAPEPILDGKQSSEDQGGTPLEKVSSTATNEPVQPVVDPIVARHVDNVMSSELGIPTLLNRLKQSVASAKEFAQFLKRRSVLEDDHAQSLRKLCRSSQDNSRRPEHRQGTFAKSYDEMISIHDRMAENGSQFAASLHQMQEELLELVANGERGRKIWKTNGLAAEHKVADLEQVMRKSKAKYDSLAEEYDRARTGEGRQGGKVLGAFKAHKSAAQQEEDLLKKVQTADQTYQSHVQTLQNEKTHLEKSARPEAVRALRNLITEIDSGVALQMQKFAAYNETLLLGNGLIVSPFRKQAVEASNQPRSLREAVAAIDNTKDLNEFVASQHDKIQPYSEVKYERNPILKPPVSSVGQPHGQGYNPPAAIPQTSSSSDGPPKSFTMGSRSSAGVMSSQGPPLPVAPLGGMTDPNRPFAQNHGRSFSQGNMLSQQAPNQQQPQSSVRNSAQPAPRYSNPMSSQGPPQLGALPFQGSQSQSSPQSTTSPQGPSFGNEPDPRNSGSLAGAPAQTSGAAPAYPSAARNMQSISQPVFGVSLNRLYERDSLAVPVVVYQCIQAVDLFGLGVEGIYRQSGSMNHINKLKGMFDAESSNPVLDFRNPENFYHDVNSVTGLLKQFFRDLPDPLLTTEHHDAFVNAAKHEDDIVRRDSLHGIINSLPDPNYATLRAMTLHLYRVMDNSHVNRMNSHNLAVIFGPTLMGSDPSTAITDAGWQIKVIDTILQNTYQIFDED